MECIILAGGLGTRLHSITDGLPKSMAPVNGLPFLHYLFNYLEQQGCTHVILSLGYKHEYITAWLETQERDIEINYVVEHEQLGTGGGIQYAIEKAVSQNIFVINGDTFFDIPLGEMMDFHREKKADTSIALKHMQDYERYGTVTTGENDCIVSFEEKKPMKEGYINGGIYLVNKASYLEKALPVKHSFEKDYLEQFVHEGAFYGFKSDAYFIDIGIPEDYHKAQTELKKFT